MKLIFGLVLSIGSLALVGCGTMDNRSLEYKKTHQLQPLVVPEGTKMRAPTPLYPAPIVEQQALDNAPAYQNQRGNRYQLPRPVLAEQQMETSTTSLPTLRPHFIYDGNRNPLLQIAGDTTTIWQYITATLSSVNYSLTKFSDTAVILQKDGLSYVVQLSKIGATHVVAVYGADGQFAPHDVASEILTQIYQNWPV